MEHCPLCNKLFDNQDKALSTYLEKDALVEAIQLKHPTWNKADGACLDCLREAYNEFSMQNGLLANPEEKTVAKISHTLIAEAEDDHNEACLIMIHGGQLGKTYQFNQEEVILGRSEHALVQIPGENVSRQHACIQRKGFDFVISDLDSTNGTYVNTRRVTEQSLRDGDLILIGNCILKFIYGTNAEAQYYEEMYRLATKDGLTQAYNKVFFLERLSEEFRRSLRYERELSIILFDLDHFHELNNTYGHIAGDHILKNLSLMISRNVRKEDLLARYGGEEFAILLPELNLKEAGILAEKLRMLVERANFEYGGKSISVTASFGVTTCGPDITSSKVLIERADIALYEAKGYGRNKVCFFEAENAA